MKVTKLMKSNVEVCGPSDSLAAIAERMRDQDIGCLPVLDTGGHVIGMITDRDTCMAALTCGQRLSDIPVSIAMSKEVLCCGPEATLVEAQEIMRWGRVRRVPVIDHAGCLVGLVSISDFARLVKREIGLRNRDLRALGVTATLAAICEPRPVEGQPTTA